MVQKNKFQDYEEGKIKQLLDVLYENQTIPLKEGCPLMGEPDGIITVNKEEIGIEVRRVSEESLQRDSAIIEIQIQLKERLSSLRSPFKVQMDGDKIPITRKELNEFIQIAEGELAKKLSTVTEGCKFEIANVPTEIYGDAGEAIEVGVSFSRSHGLQTEEFYFNEIIKSISSKNAKSYATKTTWLLLVDKTRIMGSVSNFNDLAERIKNIGINFYAIYLIPGMRFGGVINPQAIQIFPEFKPLYFENKPVPDIIKNLNIPRLL